jgi:hypothetical protein
MRIGRLTRSTVVGVFISVVNCSANAGGIAPPPTTPDLAIDLGTLGFIDKNTHLFRSYDSGVSGVGTSLVPQAWYKFSIVEQWPTKTSLRGSLATGPNYNASYTVFDKDSKPVGDLSSVGVLPSGSYYLKITAPSQTRYHFGLVASPSIASFKNDAGHDQASALSLGTLHLEIATRAPVCSGVIASSSACGGTAFGLEERRATTRSATAAAGGPSPRLTTRLSTPPSTMCSTSNAI